METAGATHVTTTDIVVYDNQFFTDFSKLGQSSQVLPAGTLVRVPDLALNGMPNVFIYTPNGDETGVFMKKEGVAQLVVFKPTKRAVVDTYLYPSHLCLDPSGILGITAHSLQMGTPIYESNNLGEGPYMVFSRGKWIYGWLKTGTVESISE